MVVLTVLFVASGKWQVAGGKWVEWVEWVEWVVWVEWV